MDAAENEPPQPVVHVWCVNHNFYKITPGRLAVRFDSVWLEDTEDDEAEEDDQ